MSSIFGPVHSRRFGVSLGVDLSPSHKQCNFDCLYCELAPSHTMSAQTDSVDVESIITELKAALDKHNKIDIITVTANGEPTLYPQLDAFVESFKHLHVKPKLLILSNSTTLSDPKIYNTLLKFDQVKLSLDAASPEVFKKIDRPHDAISIDDIILHVTRFSQDFKGKLFIEILFVKGVNDALDEIKKLNEVLLHVRCERIDIGTIDRPPAYAVEALSYHDLLTIATHFDASLPIHIASRHREYITPTSYTKEAIINTLDKRPLSEEDITILFDKASQSRLEMLISEGAITKVSRSNVVFFVPSKNLHRKRHNNS